MTNSSRVKVRFAPSPTGYLHIGGVRTALFNWFYAKNQEGIYYLRIEDTDQKRSERQYADQIKDSLCWLGLDWEGEVIFQSDNLPKYREAAQELVDKGLAHRVDEVTEAVIFPVTPTAEFRFFDLVHGEVRFSGKDVGDIVLIKSDGFPTYNFACAVDDHALGITHVIRGDDHISNTPKQMALYQAMGYPPPKYAHIPLILGDDGTPLSKRHGAVALDAFIREGYLREGLINYLTLLGWGVKGGEEFFTVDQIVKQFSIKRVNKSSATFDLQKLKAINARHLKQMAEDDYIRRFTEYLAFIGKELPLNNSGKQLLLLYKGRVKHFAELLQCTEYFFQAPDYQPEAVAAYLTKPETKDYLCALREVFAKAEFDTAPRLETTLRGAAEGLQIEAKELIHPVRVTVTGTSVSPDLFDILVLLGREKVCERIDFITQNYETLLRIPGDIS